MENREIQIDHFYKIDETLLKCVKTKPSGCNLFHVVDESGNYIIKHDPKQPGIITDHGQRIIYNRTNELIEVQLPVQQNIKLCAQLQLF